MMELKNQLHRIGLNLGEKLKSLKLSHTIAIMEVCGTHTHALFNSGIKYLLPSEVKLISGPGCPVCVTPTGYIDLALELSCYPDIIVATFGDMIRVPGSTSSLQEAQSAGADIRIVLSSLDALSLAVKNPLKKVVFLAVGFETTAPTVAAAITRAAELELKNLTFLTAHKVVPNVLKMLLSDPEIALSGLLLPGHVCAVTGSKAFNFVPVEYNVPAVIAGFEPVELLAALLKLIVSAVEGKPGLENMYGSLVSGEGNLQAQKLLKQVFSVTDSNWRGMGVIPDSGLVIKQELADYDTRRVYALEEKPTSEAAGCQCGEILKGKKAPLDCNLFKIVCNPEKPMGPCMVSSEGTCAAYYKYNG